MHLIIAGDRPNLKQNLNLLRSCRVCCLARPRATRYPLRQSLGNTSELKAWTVFQVRYRAAELTPARGTSSCNCGAWQRSAKNIPAGMFSTRSKTREQINFARLTNMVHWSQQGCRDEEQLLGGAAHRVYGKLCVTRCKCKSFSQREGSEAGLGGSN